MADCNMIAQVASASTYAKKDKSIGCNLTVRSERGQLISFFGNKSIPDFPMGTTVQIFFSINVFNGKPTSLILEEVEEFKK